MEELRELTEELVSVPSHEDETEVGNLIETWLRDETGSEVERDEVGNVVARKEGEEEEADGGNTETALVCHHDVVPPDSSQVDDGEYVVREEGGRLYGRGTADMKGAVAAALLGFRDSEPEETFTFASFVGEETGGEGARHALERGFEPDRAVVTEGSTGYSKEGDSVTDVGVAHRGRRELELTVGGVAEHASEAGYETNAIDRASRAVEKLRGLTDEPPKREVHGNEIKGSAVPTYAHAGDSDATNVTPERCVVTVDERTVPGEELSYETVEKVPGTEVETVQRVPAMVCDDRGFADGVLEVAGSHQEGKPEAVVKPHATDAGWLSEAGVDCVVVGPAEPGEAHTADESVSLDALERCYRIYRDLPSV
ncbi:MAG: M20/M25/M40 family metallo-hydrolase [Halobacteria archaeon]|nr:M20/M25/M40 family metallo-hydrolase [Halobacteria archaeon]